MREPVRRPRSRAGLGLALAVTVSAVLAGCAVAPGTPEAGATDGTAATSSGAPVDALSDASTTSLPVAVNLVSVLVQLDGHSPYDTTIQVSEPTSAFGEHLVAALELAGYGIQRVSADQGRNYLSYRRSRSSSETGTRIDHSMRLGTLGIAREVRVTDAGVVPTGPVRIRGARPEPIALNGSVYVSAPSVAVRYPSGVRFEDETGDVLAEVLYRYDYRPTGAAREANGTAPLDPTRFLERATARLYSRGSSAVGFATRADEDFAPLGQVALRFPTRSDDVLGTGNRQALERLLEYFDRATDRLTLTSCAADSGDTRASAAARSSRVKTELLTLGVPGAQVREAGCERRRYGDPPRTVKVRLERLNEPPASS